MQTEIALLQAELHSIKSAALNLIYSLERDAGFHAWQHLKPEQLECLEAKPTRFVRLFDLLIQRIFHLIDEIELVGSNTVLDRICRAEKRGLGQAIELIQTREPRDTCAHEYALDAKREIYASLFVTSQHLLQTTQQTSRFANRFLQQHASL